MAYSKQNFQNGQILNAANLEAMENGIIAGQGAKNLLVNSDFRNPIDIDNKIGATNVNPCFTRWNFERGNPNTTTQIIKIDNGIRVYKNGGVARFYQSYNYNLLGKTVSYAVGTTEGIFVGSCSVSTSSVFIRIGTHTGYISVYYSSESEKTIFSLYFNDNSEDAIDLYWAALYEGAYTKETLPNYVPKSIQQEMMDCGIPLYPKNLLKNSDFTNPSNVNRGMTSYSGAFYDIIDLWDCATPDGSTTTTKLTSNGLKFTHSDGSSNIYLRQEVSDFWKSNKNYTIGCYKDDGKFFYSGYYNPGDGKINIVIPSGFTITSVICYEGKYTEDMLPPYISERKHVEMLNCNVPLAPRNLLDNSDFTNPVNQRGQTSYSSAGYTIDRWYFYDPNGDGTVAINNGYISLTGGSGAVSLSCRFPKGFLDANKTYTARICDNLGNINPTSLIFYDSFDAFEFSAGAGETKNIAWAALYEGSYDASTLPAYQPKGYAAELAECMRYYQQYNINGISAVGDSESGITYIRCPLQVQMRTAPSLVQSSVEMWTTYSGTTNKVEVFTFYNSSPQCVHLKCTSGTGSAYQLVIATNNAAMAFSADL